MGVFSHRVSVRTTPAQLWALISDVRWMGGLFPYITIEDVQAPEPDCWLFWRQLDVPALKSLRWREENRLRDGELAFRAVEGDLETFQGRWLVTPESTTALLTLELEYVIPAGAGPAMPAPLMQYVIGQLFTTICQRVKEAAEEEAA